MSSPPSSTSPSQRPPNPLPAKNDSFRPNMPLRPPISLHQQQQFRPHPMSSQLQQQQRPISNGNMPIQQQARPLYGNTSAAPQQHQPFYARPPPQQSSIRPINHSYRPPFTAPPNITNQPQLQPAQIPPPGQQHAQSDFGAGLITPIEQSMSNLHVNKAQHHYPGKSRRVYANVNNNTAVPLQTTTAAPNNTAAVAPAMLTTGAKTPLGMPTRPVTKPRIDPNAIPSPVQLRMKKNEERLLSMLDNQAPLHHQQQAPSITQYNTNTAAYAYAPNADPSQFQQQLNCHPQIMQPTLPCIPDSENLIRDTELPFGVVIQPYYNTDKEIPVLKQEELVRCTRCKGYVNGFCQFHSSGFKCNLCGFDNKDISTSSNSSNSSGFPAVELVSNGTVEFEAPEEYWMTSNENDGVLVKPVPLHWLVAIDISRYAVQSGLVRTICNALKQWVQEQEQEQQQQQQNGTTAMAGNDHVKLGIMTFDTSLHFYDLKREQPSMMVVSDLNDVYVPMATENLFVDPLEYSAAINTLLDQLPKWHENTETPHAAFGAAVQGAQMALNPIGGKVSIMQTSLPTVGPSNSILKNRDDPSLYGTDKEKGLFQPQDKSSFYMQLGTACAQSGVSIDLWCFPPPPSGKGSYMDIATIGVLSALTGGDVHYYPSLTDPYAPPLQTPQSSSGEESEQTRRIVHDLLHSSRRKQGYGAVLRLRCSNGVSVGEHYGNFYMSNATNIELANINEDTAFGIALKHDSKLPAKQPIYLQCAILYTTIDGHRRVRVHNLRLEVGSTANAIFKSADLDVSMNFCIKRMISHATAKKSLKDIGTALDELTVHILTAYRKYCAPNASPAQLILPESFKNMPILGSSLKKSALLRKDTKIDIDTRVFNMRKMKALTVLETSQWLYPQCIQLHTWLQKLEQQYHTSSTTTPIDFSTFLMTPPLERLSYDRFDPKGIYWIHSHDDIFLWIGQEAPASITDHLFASNIALDPVQSIVTATTADDSSTHIYNTLLRKLYQQSTSTTAFLPRFHILRQGVDLEVGLAHVLVEDAIYDELSYVDYLCLIHKQIQLELEREKQESVISAASYWAHRY